jgi:tellurite resistance protein TerC
VDVGIWAWVGFVGLIVFLLGLDLFVFHRDAHEVSFREATKFSIFWISLGLAFGVVVYFWLGAQAGGEYLAGYLIEKSLSVDNIFVFALIFTYFGVPAKYQHRVLFWGILGALVFRALFIAGGAALLERFHFTIYIFGAFLVLTGIRMALHRDEEMHPEKNPVLGLFRRVVPMTSQYHGQKFTVLEAGKRVATPLMAVLVLIETSDILFAVDSIPAIFAITDDPFIVFTSNAFAILGLRALYFMLAGMMYRFVYLKIGLAVVLVYVGVKMLVSSWFHIPIWASLGFIALAITVSIVASLRSTKGDPGGGALPASHPDALGGSESTDDVGADEADAQPVEVPRTGDDGGVER